MEFKDYADAVMEYKKEGRDRNRMEFKEFINPKTMLSNPGRDRNRMEFKGYRLYQVDAGS